ncbi:MAG: phosphatase PAP2 family protein [Dehalococcoidia bacterium]|nr:phosphatase PAP2 family protein [Dehalococcoidia bacterium]
MKRKNQGRGVRRPRGRIWLILEAFLSIAGLVVAPAATFLISVLLGWAALQVTGAWLEWDTRIYLLVNGWSRPEVTKLILLLLNDPGIDYVALIAPCLLYVWLRRKWDAPWAIMAVVIALVMGSLTIPFTQQFGLRERPFVSITAAIIDPEWRKIWMLFPTFPSGHLRETVGLALVLGYFWPASRWPVAFYAFVVAVTRIYLGAHYPTDVAAGAFIGAMDGLVAVLTVNRLGWFLGLAGGLRWLKRAYAYVFVPRTTGDWARDPVPARAIRLTVMLGVLAGGGYLGGWAINYKGLRIVHDLMRNFDNSVTNPLLLRFDPQWAEGIYQVLGNGQVIYPTMAVLVLLAAARTGWRGLNKGIVVVGVTGLLVYAIVEWLGARFDRALPYSQLENSLPQEWLLPWASHSAFPQRHILAVAALAAALGHFTRPLLPVVYAYLLAVAADLLYFGAAWPTDIVISLVIGQGAAHYAAFLSQNLVPDASKRAKELP